MAVGLVVDIKGDASSLDAALGKSEGGVKGFGSALGGLVNPATIAAAGIGVAAVAIGEMTTAAAEDRDEQRKLEAAITAAGAAHGAWTEQVEAAIAAGQEKAFTDSETRAGLEALVTATGDVTAANDLLAVAQDVARKSGVSLEDASKAVAKAHAGQDGALRKLLPGMQKQATATDTIAEATRLAAGQADLYATSATGMKAKGADAFAEIGETIGSAFLPVMDEVLPALLPVIKQLGKLVAEILPLIIPLIKVLATVLGHVAGVLGTVVGWLVKLVSWLSRAIGKIGSFLDSINPLKGISLPSLPFLSSAAAAPAAAGPAARGAPRAGGVTGGVHITINGAIDPEATARQIRRILSGHGARVGSEVAI